MHEKLASLKKIIRELGSVVVAYSGGVDSTFLLKVCQEELGDGVLAVTATSETYPSTEIEAATELARRLGVRHRLIATHELEKEAFASNPPNRCYYCKGELFSELLAIAQEEGLRHVVDGANYDDLGDFRPGMQAGRELGVRSPLQEARLTKEEIRALSREMGLPTWDKPSFACLSSRFPYGQAITPERLGQVDQAERFLKGLGFRQVRVRHHDTIARIEVAREEMPRALAEGPAIAHRLRELGFLYVTLDLQGYRSGSMNEALPQDHPATKK